GNGGRALLSSTQFMFIDGSVTADGGTSGSGGKVSLSFKSAGTFLMDSSAVIEGVTGSLSAHGGSVGGDGGEISITNAGTGVISLGAAASLLAHGSQGITGGNGGSITLTSENGSIEIGGGSLLANAAGNTSSFAGGDIAITARTVFSGAGSTATLNASGSGAVNGGSVTILASETGALVIGDGPGELTIFATGGSLNSITGDGGTVSISVPGNLTVDG